MGHMKNLLIDLQNRYGINWDNDDADMDYLYEKYLEETKLREEAHHEEEYLKKLNIQKDSYINLYGDPPQK